jgi:hypothetical protein
MQRTNIQGPLLRVVFVVFSILLLAGAGKAQASIIQTATSSEAAGSIQFSSWRVSSGSLLAQSSLAVGARSTTSLASNVGYTLNTTPVTQSSYTFRPNRYELAATVDYSYGGAAAQHHPVNRHHHRHGGSPSDPPTPVVAAVPDGGSSLFLFLITLGGFASFRFLPAVIRSVAGANKAHA